MPDKPFRRLADLQQITTRVQTGAQALLIRDCAHKEYEAELRANEALVGRGNAVLASAGVAISLLMGLVARDAVINTVAAKVLLVVAFAFALRAACAVSSG
jgi:hypothetical protein